MEENRSWGEDKRRVERREWVKRRAVWVVERQVKVEG